MKSSLWLSSSRVFKRLGRLVVVGMLALGATQALAVPAQERDALIALYNSTDGVNQLTGSNSPELGQHDIH